MSIVGSMFSGISGLNANAVAMEIIGNNLANVNTPAFKYSRPDFSDVLSKVLAQGYSVGRGTQVGSTKMVFSQGGFQTTDNVTDIALSGSGFFQTYDTVNQGVYYTRTGNFSIDAQGYMISPLGYRLQGFPVDAAGDYEGVPGDVLIPQSALEPQPTTEMTIHANLASDATYVGPFDVNDPTNTSNFTTAITVYDSLGVPHQVTAYFTVQNAPGPGGGNSWDINVVVDANDATSGVDTIAITGTLDFTTDGELYDVNYSAPDFDFVGAVTQNQVINLEFGTSIIDGGTGLDGTTQFGDQSSLVFQNQDGYAPSFLEAIDIDSDGVVIGKYANGETRQFARIAVVNFTNPDGLTQLGGNLFSTSETSGEPIVAVANVSGNGSIFSSTLELSNVDIAGQFVSMITTQRGFQAASRAITTSDEMMAEAVNMTR